MRKLLLVLFTMCFLASYAHAWDGPWDINPVPYIKGKTAAPTVNDDTFIVPYLWVDETNDKFYLLIDNTSGAAVWQEVIYSGGSPTFTSLTLTNPLTVPNGGTGASTLTDGGVLLGSGTGAVTAMPILTDGQIIVGDGTTDPVAESGDTARISLGVGSTDSPTFAGISIQGGQTVKVTTVNAATYDLLVTDYILNVTYTATGTVTSLTLPTAQVVAGRVIYIKDGGGNAATYPIIIDTEGSETIDGAATITINSNYGGVGIYCDGSNWFVM